MIFEVLSWDGAVGEGVNEAELCTIGAIAKFNNPRSPYLVPNEYIVARLAVVLGLPVPPVALVRSPEGDIGIV